MGDDWISTPCNDGDIDGIYRYLGWHMSKAGFSSNCFHYLEVLKNRAAQVEAMGWQPIETAPKDKDILIHINGSQWPVRVAFYREALCEWRCDLTGNVISPDYWMPLPQPPKE